jgi:hypothetical protein
MKRKTLNGRIRASDLTRCIDATASQIMRTTLDIDDDVLQTAKEMAAKEKRSAGAVISDLARRGFHSNPTPATTSFWECVCS